MIIVIFLLLLLLSFGVHIYFLILYIIRVRNNYLQWFVNTAVSNILIAGVVCFLLVYKPALIREIDTTFTLWLISGFVMIVALVIKINLFMRMRRNMKDPKNFHYNFFGKKVLHKEAVSKVDVLLFFMSMPFFLMGGAYFIARLVNYILFGRL
jgi:hypothetical protein